MPLTDRVRQILSWYSSENPGTQTNLVRLLNHGTLAGTGHMSFFASLFYVLLASVTADSIWYYLGRRKGAHLGIIQRLPARKFAAFAEPGHGVQIAAIGGNGMAAHSPFLRKMR